MKRKVVLILAIVCLVSLLIIPGLAGCTKRENVLKVLSVAEYIDPEQITAFEKYYKEITGEKITVKYQEVDTNELMYAKIATKNSDYDILCPSDYMVERMHKENLLLDLAEDLGENVEDYRKNVSSFITDENGLFASISSKYSCAYMWGTMGIVYNREKIPTSEISSQGWGSLWNSKYSGKIQMKDSVRDSYAAAALYTFKNTASAHYDATMTIAQALNATNDSQLEIVKKMLIAQSPYVYGYEVDTGKTDIVLGDSDLLLQWSGDAVYTLSEEHMDDCGKYPDLAYYVPEEGANVWCDYWVIPAYAGNKRAADLWINFMCSDEAAIANMDYIGYTSAIASQATFDYAIDYADCMEDGVSIDEDRYTNVDLSYFFSTIEEAKTPVFTDIVQFPSKDIVDRCAVMVDYGDKNETIQNLWYAVKSNAQ